MSENHQDNPTLIPSTGTSTTTATTSANHQHHHHHHHHHQQQQQHNNLIINNNSINQFDGVPPGHSALHLPPATQKTVITTTTTTTLTFPPIILPRPPVPENPFSSYHLNSKLYPLATLAVPPDWKSRGLSISRTDSTNLIQLNPDRSDVVEGCSNGNGGGGEDEDSDAEAGESREGERREGGAGPSINRSRSLKALSPSSRSHHQPRKRNPLLKLASQPVNTLTSPPRKKPRLTDQDRKSSPTHARTPNNPNSEETPGLQHLRRPSGLPSPLPTHTDLPQPDSTLAAHSEKLLQAAQHSQSVTHPLQGSPSSQAQISTLLSLPNLVQQYSELPAHLQEYTLFNLLRQSRVPVLQFAQSLIGPALKRDIISDLPPEVSALILSRLDGPSLCRITRVNQTWRTLINRGRSIWKTRLVEEDLWVGGGTEEVEADECVLLEAGVTRPEVDRFTRLWNAGTWKRAPSPGGGVDEMVTDATPELQDRAEAAPDQASSSRVPATPTSRSRSSSRQQTPSRTRTSPQGFSSSEVVDPYKLVYRKRFLTRKNWMKREPKRTSFPGHALTVVTCLQFDWDKMVAASDDNVVHSYEFRTGRRLRSFVGHQGGVWALQFVGDTLVTGSTDRTVRVWDMATGRNTHVFHGHTSTVRCLQIVEPVNLSPNSREDGNFSDETDRDSDGVTGRGDRRNFGDGEIDSSPKWEPAYPLIVTGSRDYTLRVWRLPAISDEEYVGYPAPGSPEDSGAMVDSSTSNPFHLHHLTGHAHAVRALAAFGRTMVSGSYDCTVRVWDILTGECKQEMRGHTQKVYSVVLDHLRGRCASGSMDNTVRLWDLSTGTTLKVLGDHSSLVGLLGLSPNRLVSAAADATLRIWDPLTGSSRQELKGHLGAITCFSHDQFRVVSGADGTLKLWNPSNGELVRDLLNGFSAVWQVGIDDRFCVAAVQRGNESEYVVLDFGRTDGKNDGSSSSNGNEPQVEIHNQQPNQNQLQNHHLNHNNPPPPPNHHHHRHHHHQRNNNLRNRSPFNNDDDHQIQGQQGQNWNEFEIGNNVGNHNNEIINNGSNLGL